MDEEKKSFIASFYPLYVMMLNIADGVQGIEVVNMLENHGGCLHGFQLRPQDLKNIEKSSAFIINGAGMEPFLERIMEQYPEIEMIDSSEGINLLPCSSNRDDLNKDPHNHEYNPHIWLSIENHIKQVHNISEKLAHADTANADYYLKNASFYIEKLNNLKEEIHKKLDNLPNKNIVTFHDAFAYFVDEFGLKTVGFVSSDPHNQPSALEISGIIEIIKRYDVKAIFTEPQYPEDIVKTLSEQTGCKIYVLDSGVSGTEDKDSYINIMRKNAEILAEALS
jgi:zinc transport system substrate-binding protein